jgi:integrase
VSIYKPKGRKHYSYDFKINGVRFRGGTRTESKKAALAVEQRVRNEVAQWAAAGASAPKAPMTASEAFARYAMEKAEDRPSERDTYYQLSNLLAHFGKDAPLTDLTDPDLISAYVAMRRAGVSDASVNREVELLRRVVRRAATVWKRQTGPMPDWSQLLLAEPAGRIRELGAAEEAELFKHLRHDLHAPVRFAIMTGLRLSAILSLTWHQVDWDAGRIMVRLKSRQPGGRPHVLPITRPMRALLQGLRGQHQIHCFTYVCAKSRAQRRKGERYPFSRNGWRKDWAAALKAAKIEDFRFHDLRHTAASRIVRVSNLKAGQEFLGHATIASTARYAHVTISDVERAMEAMQMAEPKEQKEAK